MSRRRAAFPPALLALCLLAGSIPASAAPAATPGELLDRLEKAWQDRNVAAYLELWSFPSAEAREEERSFAMERFAAEQSPLEVQRPQKLPADPAREPVKVSAQLFTLTEPRARVEQWLFSLRTESAGWQLSAREAVGFIDGLVHLALDPTGYRADGLTLRFDDFTLELHHGTLFTSPASMGPTALAFVGDATVHVRPWPENEREQLRQFAGKPELVDRVKAAFVRIHPADLYRVVSPARLEPDPQGANRFPAAQRFYHEQSLRSFVLDSSLPRSPWWLLPGLGDSSTTFQTRRHGTLTFTVSTSEAESISLFDRDRKRQICLYAQEGRESRYNEDDSRSVDVVHHDLKVRFDPRAYALEAEDTIRLRLLEPNATVRLRLDEDLHIHSITSAEVGLHLFFRVRHQDTVMVSLGALGGRTGDVSLTVRYGGALYPGPVEREIVQAPGPGPPPPGQIAPPPMPEEVPIEEVLVYSNRSSWYPQGGPDDYAMADLVFDVPQGYNAVAGGTRLGMRTEAGRTRVAYHQDRPGKYITVAIGRLAEVVTRVPASVPVQSFSVGRTRGEATAYVAKVAEILRFYEAEFGPYPYGSLTVVVVEGRTPGGHSPPGMVIMAQRPLLLRQPLRDDPANFTDVPYFFLAHELAHQWWGQGVAGENYHERWLSEGFAQYAAVLWTRHSEGEDAFRDVMDRMGRWALRMTDKGPIHLGHRLGHLKEDPQIFRAVVYDKGAYVLHMLRGVVGDAAFGTALHAFQAAHRFRKAGTDDLRQALEAAAGRDLRPYFETWVRGTVLPRLQVSSGTAPAPAGYLTRVEVKAEGLPAPVPLQIALDLGSGKDLRQVSLPPGGGSWSFETGVPVGKVRVNDDRGLLARVER